MPLARLIRPAVAVGLLMLMAGCVPPPAPVLATGQAYYSQQCYAGFYQCVLPGPQAVGSGCACPGIGAPSYGTVR